MDFFIIKAGVMVFTKNNIQLNKSEPASGLVLEAGMEPFLLVLSHGAGSLPGGYLLIICVYALSTSATA
jgi:hypothetical protein